ncbi:MAG: hypothetical protein AB7I34_13470 [Rhizobiaceae bacterium]
MRTFTLKAGLTTTLLFLSVAGTFAASAPLTELQREALENHDAIVASMSDQVAPEHGYATHAIHPTKAFIGRSINPPYPGEPRLR